MKSESARVQIYKAARVVQIKLAGLNLANGMEVDLERNARLGFRLVARDDGGRQQVIDPVLTHDSAEPLRKMIAGLEERLSSMQHAYGNLAKMLFRVMPDVEYLSNTVGLKRKDAGGWVADHVLPKSLEVSRSRRG